jgi:transposase-like protein
MIQKTHQSHAKTTRVLIVLFFLVALIPFSASFYAAKVLNNQHLVDIFVLSFMVLFAFTMLVAILRTVTCQCPACKSWLFTKQKDETVKFVCKKCNVVWDSKIPVGD